MAWAQWDDERDLLLSVVKDLPDTVKDLPEDQRTALGYRELVIEEPDDIIPRFRNLLNAADFRKGDDGRIHQSYPHADFSVASVREALKGDVQRDARVRLMDTDWHVIRSVELGTPIPDEIVALRKRIRDHTDTVQEQIDSLDQRSLVDFRWSFPTSPDQIIVNGVPTRMITTLPVPVPPPKDLNATTEPSSDSPPSFLTDNEDSHLARVVPAGPTPLYVYEEPPVPPTTDGPVQHTHIVTNPEIDPLPELNDGVPREFRGSETSAN